MECVLTVFEEAGMNKTINIEQLTVTLQERILSFEDPLFVVNEDSVIIGGWSEEQITETNEYMYTCVCLCVYVPSFSHFSLSAICLV